MNSVIWILVFLSMALQCSTDRNAKQDAPSCHSRRWGDDPRWNSQGVLGICILIWVTQRG